MTFAENRHRDQPPWLRKNLKFGGEGGGLLLLIFMCINPLLGLVRTNNIATASTHSFFLLLQLLVTSSTCQKYFIFLLRNNLYSEMLENNFKKITVNCHCYLLLNIALYCESTWKMSVKTHTRRYFFGSYLYVK